MKLKGRLTEKEYNELLGDSKNLECLGMPIIEMTQEELLVAISFSMRVQGAIRRKVNFVPIGKV